MEKVILANQKKIYLLNPRGFCAGVVRAIDAVERAITRYGTPIYVRRQIVHNAAVVKRLEKLGAIFIQEIEEAPEGATILLSAHGVSPDIKSAAASRDQHIIDTICPLVFKVHQEVRRQHLAGKHILLIGHAGHPEIVGTVGQLPAGAITIIESISDVDALSLPPDSLVAYAVQTTFSVKDAANIIAYIHSLFPNVAGPKSSDICYATTNRQDAVENVSHMVDHLIVVGDATSSNAKRLTEVGISNGIDAVQLVNDGAGINFSLLFDAQNIAITAAASCPQESVNDVIDNVVRNWGGEVIEFGENLEISSFKPVNIERIVRATPHSSDLVEQLKALSREIDALLSDILTPKGGGEGRLIDAMRYAVIDGGKRLRAMLTVATGELFKVDRNQLIRVAAALECIHAQSLIHDDLPAMDNDDIRRGKPTVHRQYDEATAILAGDALMALAFEIIADEKTHPDPIIRSTLVSHIAKSIGSNGLASGQMMDLFPSDEPNITEVIECQKRKTGKLIETSVYAGVLLGRADTHKTHLLMQYAKNLGLAFQIRDDILDEIGDEEKVGKKLSKDMDLGRVNTVKIMGLEQAKIEAQRLSSECSKIAFSLNPLHSTLKDIADFVVMRLA